MERDITSIAQQVKDSCTVIEVAAWFGYDYDEEQNHPCPKCESESSSRRTLRVYDSQRWFCFHCDEGGDAIDWLAARLRTTKGIAIKLLATRLGIESDAADLVSLVRHQLFAEQVRSLSKDAEGDAIARRIVSAAKQDRATRFVQRIDSDTRPSWSDRAIGWVMLLRMARSGATGRDRAKSMLSRIVAGDSFPPVVKKKEHLRNAYLASTYRDQLRKSSSMSQYAERRGWLESDLSEFTIGACTHQGAHMAGRITFPIRDAAGRTVGFGGRLVDERIADPKFAKAKYLNSADRGVFRKSRELYGMDRALTSIIATGRAVLVEGYADVLACHRDEVPQAVAPLGGSLSQVAAETLAILCDEVVIVRDEDAAGKKASRRWVYELRAVRVTPYVAKLPDGMDPDDYLVARGRGSLRAIVKHCGECGRRDVLSAVRRVFT